MTGQQQDFVRISDDGLHFQVADKPFFFAGANCYYLMVRGTAACTSEFDRKIADRLLLFISAEQARCT